MEVSLKKAHKLQKELEGLLNATPNGVEVEISIYEDYTVDKISAVIADARKMAQENIDKNQKILAWIYEIRGSIADVNKKVGIDVLLTQKALNDKMMNTANQLDVLGLRASKKEEDPATVMRRLDAMREKASQPSSGMDRYGSTPLDKWTTTVFPASDDAVKRLKRIKNGIEEQLTALNASTMVTISEDIEKYLTDEGIL